MDKNKINTDITNSYVDRSDEINNNNTDITNSYVDRSDEIKIPLFFSERTKVNSKVYFTVYGIILLISLICSSVLLILSFSGKSGSKFVSNTRKT